MKSKREVRLVNALATDDEQVRNDAKAFWRGHKVLLKEEVIDKRANQLVYLAYNAEGKVIAASTALKARIILLNDNYLYQYRCFIDPAYRTIGFDCHLTLESLKLLEEVSSQDSDKPIGVYVVVENKRLYGDKIHNAAVWRAYKMYFIGYNSKDQPIRVYYFKDALI